MSLALNAYQYSKIPLCDLACKSSELWQLRYTGAHVVAAYKILNNCVWI